MTAESGCVYSDFNYSLNVERLLETKDGDLDILLQQYGVTQTSVTEMITSIQEWFEKQPHLPQGQLHDKMILGHLITRGFSVEQAKEKIDNYFSVKNRMPDLLSDRDPLRPVMDLHLKHGYWIILPKRTPENRRIIIFRLVHPKDLVVAEVMRLGFMFGEYRLFNETTSGDHWVYDFSQAWLQHALLFSPLITNLYYHITNCYSLKIKGFHVVNLPSFAHTVLEAFKKIMKTKHVERLHFYKNFEDVFMVLPKDVFPKDLGGSADMTCQDVADSWRETLQSDTWSWFFRNQEKNYISDESKRRGSTNGNDIFGVEGSFRRLDLD